MSGEKATIRADESVQVASMIVYPDERAPLRVLLHPYVTSIVLIIPFMFGIVVCTSSSIQAKSWNSINRVEFSIIVRDRELGERPLRTLHSISIVHLLCPSFHTNNDVHVSQRPCVQGTAVSEHPISTLHGYQRSRRLTLVFYAQRIVKQLHELLERACPQTAD